MIGRLSSGSHRRKRTMGRQLLPTVKKEMQELRKRTDLSRSSKLSFATLSAVDAVIEYGSLTKAAYHLGISQPAISGHLRRFEEHFGFPAMKRAGNQMVVCSDECRDLVRQLLLVERRLASLKRSAKHAKPKIGICSSISGLLMNCGNQISRVATSFQVHIATQHLLQQRLDFGYLDAIIVPSSGNEDVIAVRDFALLWVTGKESDQIDDGNEPLKIVLPNTPSSITTTARNWLATNGIAFELCVEADHLSDIVSACHHLGVAALIPNSKGMTEALGLKAILTQYSPIPSVEFGVVTRGDRISVRAAEDLLEDISQGNRNESPPPALGVLPISHNMQPFAKYSACGGLEIGRTGGGHGY